MPSSLSEYERLFLLEFYVDFVTIQNIAFDFGESKLCVSFQFLHYPVMRVCEVDFKPETPKPVTEDSKIVFRSGKSCMFSVHPDENNTISSSFNLIISVCQTREGCTRKELVGQAAVNLGESFLNLLQPSGDLTMDSGTKHDLFPLKDKFKRTVGSVAAFARISNFGKMIVTQFQLAEDSNMNYMFKGTDPNKLFKDDPAMKDFPKIVTDEPQKTPETRMTPSIPRKMAPLKKPQYDSSSDSCDDDSDETECSESEKTTLTGETSVKGSVVDSVIKEPGDGENFREIGAEINGHAITIRVIKKRKIPPIVIPPPCCCPPEPPMCPYAPKLNLCDCDFPLPPDLLPRCPAQCCCTQSPPSLRNLTTENDIPRIKSELGSNKIAPEASVGTKDDTPSSPVGISDEEIPPVLVCPNEDCPLGLYQPGPPPDPMELEPGCVAMKGDQVFFQMTNRPAGEPVNEKEQKLAGSVYYSLGVTEGGKETMGNVIQITPQTPQGPLTECVDGPVSGLPLECHQDMFLFKVQQQNDQIHTTSRLEMELRTPKEKYPKPESNTVDTQYLLTDIPPPEKKSKKGKKGDDKGKGAGKGKGGGKKGKKGK